MHLYHNKITAYVLFNSTTVFSLYGIKFLLLYSSQIEYADLSNCLDKGVSSGEESIVDINNIKINNTTMGLVSKDFSQLLINNAIIKNSNWCLQAYNKKSEFSGGLLNIKYLNCNESINIDDHIKSDYRSKIIYENY